MIELLKFAPLPVALLMVAAFGLLLAAPPMVRTGILSTPQARRSYRLSFRLVLVCCSVLLLGCVPDGSDPVPAPALASAMGPGLHALGDFVNGRDVAQLKG